MKVKTARCPNCGAKIRVNPDLKVATCRYCQQEYEVEPAIHAFEMEDVNDAQSPRDRIRVEETTNENVRTITVNVKRIKHIRTYTDLRYEIVSKKYNKFHDYTYVLSRPVCFDDPKLMEIENKIFEVFLFEPDNKTLVRQEKKKWIELASYKGLLN